MALIVWRVMPNALGEILLRHLVALEAQSANRGLQRNEPIPLVEGRPDIARRANRDDHSATISMTTNVATDPLRVCYARHSVLLS